MKIQLEIDEIRRFLTFDYLQLFRVDDLEESPNFVEHFLAKEVMPPVNDRFKLASNLALMRFVRDGQKPMVLIKKSEVLNDWRYNIIELCLNAERYHFLLLIYTQQLPAIPIDVIRLSNVVTIELDTPTNGARDANEQ